MRTLAGSTVLRSQDVVYFPPRSAARADWTFLDDCLARHSEAVETLERRATATQGGETYPQYLAGLIDTASGSEMTCGYSRSSRCLIEFRCKNVCSV
jgi:hypothetical protein